MSLISDLTWQLSVVPVSPHGYWVIGGGVPCVRLYISEDEAFRLFITGSLLLISCPFDLGFGHGNLISQ